MIDIDLIFIQDTYWGHNKIYQIIWPLYVKVKVTAKNKIWVNIMRIVANND